MANNFLLLHSLLVLSSALEAMVIGLLSEQFILVAQMSAFVHVANDNAHLCSLVCTVV